MAIEYPQPGAGAGEDLEAALAAFEEPIPESVLRAPLSPEFALLARDDGWDRGRSGRRAYRPHEVSTRAGDAARSGSGA